MNRTLPALAALLAFTACDRSDPPVNQVGIDLNAVTPAPEPAPQAPTANETAPANGAAPVASTTIPAAYHGVYDQTAAACASASSIYRLTVSGDELRFHESLAEVQSVTPEGENAIRVAANYSGEGMTWSNIQRVALSDGGRTLTITGEGEPVKRTRCG
ncbi:hypothetical protein D1610_00345 [Sphingomonas gilva]|uniref:Uncharacterized protein n=1 Tax=Sphingomonas gilva TaxID=2305907 RepID=A0A396RQB7_9SPHN|nr:hypothetical protein [Sphingomonas gilva]RHW18658.1 hypothetical protein D1610_00345 [Sphingomonas gilva]